MDKRLPPRFAEKFQVSDSGCWVWIAGKTGGGYAAFHLSVDVAGSSVKRRTKVYGHRYAYELLVGPIPDGLTLDHLCRNPGCVNPEHLEPVSIRVNILRGNNLAARNARKTHCKRGHELTGTNLRVNRGGGRACRACHNERSIRRYAAKKVLADGG